MAGLGRLAGAAFGAVRHPIDTVGNLLGKAVGAAGGAVQTGTAVAGAVTSKAKGKAGHARGSVAGTVEVTRERTGQAAEKAAAKLDRTADRLEDAADRAAQKADADAPEGRERQEESPADREPQVVLREPGPPAEPPIDIVGQVLAAEAEGEPHAVHTEPRGASRDEEHGDAALQRAEADEIEEEVAEALPGGDLDVEPPVVTPATVKKAASARKPAKRAEARKQS